jgi:hypothetical protein
MREHRRHSRDLRRQQRICITSRIKALTETRYPYGSLHYTSVNDAVEVEDDFASRRPIRGYLGSGSHYLASDIRLTSHYHDWQSHAGLPVQCTCVQCLFLDVGKVYTQVSCGIMLHRVMLSLNRWARILWLSFDLIQQRYSQLYRISSTSRYNPFCFSSHSSPDRSRTRKSLFARRQ